MLWPYTYTVCNRYGLSVGAVVMPARYVPDGAGSVIGMDCLLVLLLCLPGMYLMGQGL